MMGGVNSRSTGFARSLGRVLGAFLVAWLCVLGGCEDPRERVTRNRIHQLAFRAAQLDQALVLCDAQGRIASDHAQLWGDALVAAEGWIGLSGESIAARRAAGREAFDHMDEGLCPQVMDRASASLEQGRRWAERITARQLCSLADCGD